MKLWYLGDSVLSPTMQSIATTLGLELVDSSTPSAVMEEVWTQQLHDEIFRPRVKPETKAVIFLNNPDYDAEVLIKVLLSKLPAVQRIVLVVTPVDAPAAEGMEAHWTGEKFKTAKLGNLSQAEEAITMALQ